MYTARDATTAAAANAAPSRTDEAYRELKTRILRGEFPLNVRLGETRLAGLLGVSRTPVREALTRLDAEGLVEPHPDGGFRPCVPDTVVVRDLYEVRLGLEIQLLQRPGRLGRHHDPAVLEPLRDRWRRFAAEPPSPDPDFVLLDESFHVSLAAASGNAVAADLLQQVNERIRVVRMQDFLTPERIEATIAEHLGIVEQVLAGDLVAAEAAFTAHITASIAVVEERVRLAIARMATGGLS